MTRRSHVPSRRRRLIGPVLAAAALAATLGTVAPSAAHGAVRALPPATVAEAGVRWSVAPADDDGPDGRVSLRHVLDPGASVSDAIAVTNLGSGPAEFSVTAGDGVVSPDGAFDVADGEPVRSGSWVAVDGLDDGRLALDGGETRVLPVHVRVPAEATPGDHPAGVVVGLSEDAGGVTVTHRIGVRLHLQVAGDLAPALEVRGMTTTFTPSWVPFAPGTLRVGYEVANTGNTRLGAATRVGATAPLGLATTGGADDIDELLPGDTAVRVLELRAWPLMALSGDVSVAALTVGDDQLALPQAVGTAFSLAAVSWTGVAVLALLVVLAVLRHRARTRRVRATG